MADFVDFQAIDDNDNYDSNTDAESDANVSDIEFTDDENDFNESVETYYALTNVNRCLENAVQDSFIDLIILRKQIITVLTTMMLLSDDVIDKCKDSTKKVNDFSSTLLIPHGLQNKDSFYFALLFAIRYQLKNKKNECIIDELQKDLAFRDRT